MEELISTSTSVVPRWFRLSKTYKRILLAGALTTAAIIITWNFRSRKSKSKPSHSLEEDEILDEEMVGFSERCTMAMCMRSQETVRTCPLCQLEPANQNKEEFARYSEECSTESLQCKLKLSESEFGLDSEREAKLGNHHQNGMLLVKFGSASSPLENGSPKKHVGIALMDHSYAASPLSSTGTDSGFGFPSFVSKVDTFSAFSTPMSKHPIDSRSGIITSDCSVAISHAQWSQKPTCQPVSLSIPDLDGKANAGFDNKVPVMPIEGMDDTQVLKSVLYSSKVLHKAKIDEAVESHDNIDLSMSRPSVPSADENVFFQFLGGDLSVGANQESYLAKLHTYNDYLKDPKLPAHMKSQVQRAKMALQTFYDVGEM